MKITAINGSPKGESGNTHVIVSAFLSGASAAGAEVENILLAHREINHCMACSQCIASGEGDCVIEDDMESLVRKFVESDIVVLATPLYIDNISGMLKVFMDRLFCIGNPGFEKDENGEYRNHKSKRFKNGAPPKVVIISNGGYPERSNFQVISLLMKRFARNFHLELIAEIYAPEGPLLTAGIQQLEPVLNGYKGLLQKAGQEIVTSLQLTEATQQSLEKNFIPVELYVQETNKMFERLTR